MASGRRFTNTVLAAAVLSLGVGLAFLVTGCGSTLNRNADTPPFSSPLTSVLTVRPALDVAAPRDFQSATFALG